MTYERQANRRVTFRYAQIPVVQNEAVDKVCRNYFFLWIIINSSV